MVTIGPKVVNIETISVILNFLCRWCSTLKKATRIDKHVATHSILDARTASCISCEGKSGTKYFNINLLVNTPNPSINAEINKFKKNNVDDTELSSSLFFVNLEMEGNIKKPLQLASYP